MVTASPLEDVYERARVARDPRFDGRFFVGVRTTGIYCRPVCPANMPRRENVTVFKTAAAASEAGYRPCLRCRPECAPGTPAWSGTSATVRRGLKLIADGALDEGNVEQLADRLGVTSRHLRRLFTRHLGASPLAVARTQRLQFAKRLIDETRLPMREIAVAAGYGSVRRFNDTFRSTYGRAPRELRRAGGEESALCKGAALTVKLPHGAMSDWAGQCRFHALRAIPGAEAVTDGTYRRVVRADGETGLLEVSEDPATGQLALTLHGIDTRSLFVLVQKCRDVFDLDAPLADIRLRLREDPVLAAIIEDHGVVRVPGAWDGFELAVRAILGQQVSVKAATTLAGRVAAEYGEPVAKEVRESCGTDAPRVAFPGSRALQRARLERLGIVKSRADTIRRVAAAVEGGELRFDGAADPAAFREQLLSIRGIGSWTAEYVAMRGLKDPDAFPASDLGLLKAFDGPAGRRLRPQEMAERAECWRPWRAYAALLLWSSFASSGG